ncbi:MAG: chemotaxis protein CheW [Gammaproteobacteria bacterium]
MSAAPALEPLSLLLDIESRSRRNALGIPQQVEVRRSWSGIGFRVGQHRLVAAIGDVREILEYPPLTRVPGALKWVKGISNVRGNLLPIMDLKGFLEGEETSLGRRTRVLVVRHGGLAAGLVVDEVLGLRHFFDEDATDEVPAADKLGEFLNGAYRQGGNLWAVFSVRALAHSQQFMQVGGRV